MEFQYKGLKATYEKVEVTQSEIDRRLEQLRQQSPAITVVTDRVTQLGDEVVLDYIGTCGGIAFEGGSATDQSLVLGSGTFIPGFEEQLLGQENGAAVTVNVTFPDNYGHRDLAGKAAEFACRIKQIRVRREYALDDTFAREVGHCDNLEELRKLMGESLRAYYDEQSEQELLGKLMHQAAENLDYAPEEEELEKMVEQQMQTMEVQLAQKGLHLEDYCRFTGSTMEQLREDQRPEAVQQLRIQAAIRAIAEAEQLKAEEAEIAEACAEICRMNDITAQQLEEVYDEEFAQTVRMNVIGRKVLQLLRKNAVITEKE